MEHKMSLGDELKDKFLYESNRLMALNLPETLVISGVESCQNPSEAEFLSPSSCAGLLKGYEERKKGLSKS
jgi:hypothetical protein